MTIIIRKGQKMKTKKVLSIALTLLLVLSALTGCTPKDKENGESSTGEGSSITVITNSDNESSTTPESSETSETSQTSESSETSETSQTSEASEESSKPEESSESQTSKPEESSQTGGSIEEGESSESSESSEASESSETSESSTSSESSSSESSESSTSTESSGSNEESSGSSGGGQTLPLVLFDNEYMTLILTASYERMGYMAEVQAINKTDHELEISLSNEAVNGFEFSLYWWNMLDAGETSNLQMYIQDGWLENIGLTPTNISTFSFTFKGAYSPDGEKWEEFYEDCVIYPQW